MSDSKPGLHGKYEVYKDGELVEDCFVLEPVVDDAAKDAIHRYSEATDNRDLAEDLREWLKDIRRETPPDPSPGWYAIDGFHQDPATILSGPHKSAEAASRAASVLGIGSGSVMHTPALVNAVKNDGYTVEWSESATKPKALQADATLDLSDLKALHLHGRVVKDDVVIEASEGCSERLEEAAEAGVLLV